MELYSIKVHQSPSKFLTKVFDAGLHGQNTSSKKTLTKFLMENFDRVNGVNMAGNSRQTNSTKMSKCNWTNELVNDLIDLVEEIIKVFRKIGWSSIPSKFIKVRQSF
jgi:hypothetical protein